MVTREDVDKAYDAYRAAEAKADYSNSKLSKQPNEMMSALAAWTKYWELKREYKIKIGVNDNGRAYDTRR